MLGAEVVKQSLEQHRTGELAKRLRAILTFLEKLTLTPRNMGRDDAAHVLEAGVSPAALSEAIHVAALHTIVGHIADALDFEIPRALSPHGVMRRLTDGNGAPDTE